LIYSCFSPATGLYDYHEDGTRLPLNADLPVPLHLGAEVNGVGVPAIVAGRPKPAGTTWIGHGWNARGMVVDCGRAPLGAAESGAPPTWKIALAVAVGVAVVYWVSRRDENYGREPYERRFEYNRLARPRRRRT
jgi:hypothetical protein